MHKGFDPLGDVLKPVGSTGTISSTGSLHATQPQIIPGAAQTQQSGKVLTGDLDSSLASLADNLVINKSASASMKWVANVPVMWFMLTISLLLGVCNGIHLRIKRNHKTGRLSRWWQQPAPIIVQWWGKLNIKTFRNLLRDCKYWNDSKDWSLSKLQLQIRLCFSRF